MLDFSLDDRQTSAPIFRRAACPNLASREVQSCDDRNPRKHSILHVD